MSNKNYIMLNGNKIDLTEEQVRQIYNSNAIGNKKLSDIAVGDTFKVGGYEFIVLEHSKETTAVILKDLLENSMRFGKNNNFADKDCVVRARLNDFAIELEKIVGKHNLILHTVDLTSDDGLKDYGTMKAKASLLTCNLYRRYVEILDKHKLNKWWWLCTAFSTPKHNDTGCVKCVSPSGYVSSRNYYVNGGVRPFCIFDSNIFVSRGN